ncbi:MAG: hypothetical protein ABWY05_14785 [Noviherbaspirillum sp.]
MNAARVPGSRSALVLLMLCCLLSAQWLGLGHRVAHAGFNDAAQAVKTITGSEADLRHSCAAFDEATLPALLNTPPYAAPLLPGASVIALWSAFLSWQQPHACHFQSRAPPLS